MRTAIPLVLLGLLVGCSTVDSKDIRTSGLTADLEITTTGSTAQVTATYRVGNLTFVELEDGEEVIASGAGDPVRLKGSKLAGATVYAGKLDPAVPGAEITIDLRRTGENKSAPKSTVKLPEPVDFSAPEAGISLSRRASVVVGMRPGPDQVLSWVGNCVQTGSLRIEPGQDRISLPRGTIRAAAPQTATPTASPPTPPSTDCLLEFKLTRRIEGSLDGEYKDGSIVARAVATRQVRSVP